MSVTLQVDVEVNNITKLCAVSFNLLNVNCDVIILIKNIFKCVENVF